MKESAVHKKEIISLALSCKGWTDDLKLSKLFDLAEEVESLPGDILEIGSAHSPKHALTTGICTLRTKEGLDILPSFSRSRIDLHIRCLWRGLGYFLFLP